jgi:hypothetical protein
LQEYIICISSIPTGGQLPLLTQLEMQLAAIVGIVGGSIFLFGIVYKIYKAAHRLESAIGVDEKGRTMSDRMERVEYQLWENGGESMKDKVNDAALLAKETSVEVKFIKEVLLQLLALPEMSQAPAPAKTRKRKSSAA